MLWSWFLTTINQPTEWKYRTSENNLTLNTDKTKKLITNFGRSQKLEYAPVFMNRDRVERVSSFRFLGTFISEDITWSINTTALIKKAQQLQFSQSRSMLRQSLMFFLRMLRKAGLPQQMLITFYRCTIERILTYCISVWFHSCIGKW